MSIHPPQCQTMRVRCPAAPITLIRTRHRPETAHDWRSQLGLSPPAMCRHRRRLEAPACCVSDARSVLGRHIGKLPVLRVRLIQWQSISFSGRREVLTPTEQIRHAVLHPRPTCIALGMRATPPCRFRCPPRWDRAIVPTLRVSHRGRQHSHLQYEATSP